MYGIEPFHVLISIIIGTASLAGVGFRIWRYFSTYMDKLDKRGWRQSQAIILLAEDRDELKPRLHPDKVIAPVKPKIERILKDDKGNL